MADPRGATRKVQPTEAEVARGETLSEEQVDEMTETIEGGRFRMPDGRLVNSEGQEITKDGKVKNPDD